MPPKVSFVMLQAGNLTSREELHDFSPSYHFVENPCDASSCHAVDVFFGEFERPISFVFSEQEPLLGVIIVISSRRVASFIP